MLWISIKKTQIPIYQRDEIKHDVEDAENLKTLPNSYLLIEI